MDANHGADPINTNGSMIIDLDPEPPPAEQRQQQTNPPMDGQPRKGESKGRPRVGKKELEALGQVGVQGGGGRTTRSKPEPSSPRQLRLGLRKNSPGSHGPGIPALDLNSPKTRGEGSGRRGVGTPPGKQVRFGGSSPMKSPRSEGRQFPVEACLALPASPQPLKTLDSPRDPSMVVRFNLKQGFQGFGSSSEGVARSPGGGFGGDRGSEERFGVLGAGRSPRANGSERELDLRSPSLAGDAEKGPRQRRDGKLKSSVHKRREGRDRQKKEGPREVIELDPGSDGGLDGDARLAVRSVKGPGGSPQADKKERPRLRVRIVNSASAGFPGEGPFQYPSVMRGEESARLDDSLGGGAKGAEKSGGGESTRSPGEKRKKRRRDGDPSKFEIKIKRKHLQQGKKSPEGEERIEAPKYQEEEKPTTGLKSEPDLGDGMQRGELRSPKQKEGLVRRKDDKLPRKGKKKAGLEDEPDARAQMNQGQGLQPESTHSRDVETGVKDEDRSTDTGLETEGVGGNKLQTGVNRRREAVREKLKTDEEVMKRADEILSQQALVALGGKMRPSAEPPRPLPEGAVEGKTHWEHLLAEMNWLAKDFEKERRWKMAQAKKVALKASKAQLDVEARDQKRVRDEESRVKKTASMIAREVRKFWVKIEKLVQYKQSALAEETKKKALDKHLDFLVGQTERYSTMLAADLHGRPGSGTSRGSGELGTSRGSERELGTSRGSGDGAEAGRELGKSRLALTDGAASGPEVWSREEEARGGAGEGNIGGGEEEGREVEGEDERKLGGLGGAAQPDGDADFEVGEDDQEEVRIISLCVVFSSLKIPDIHDLLPCGADILFSVEQDWRCKTLIKPLACLPGCGGKSHSCWLRVGYRGLIHSTL
jgi:hypothetical protein